MSMNDYFKYLANKLIHKQFFQKTNMKAEL